MTEMYTIKSFKQNSVEELSHLKALQIILTPPPFPTLLQPMNVEDFLLLTDIYIYFFHLQGGNTIIQNHFKSHTQFLPK